MIIIRRKCEQSEIFKLDARKLVENELVIENYDKVQSKLDGETVKIMDNLTFKKIRDYHKDSDTAWEMKDELINVVIPIGDRSLKKYECLLNEGFTLNGKKYVRFMSGSGQIRRNTITFIREELYQYVFDSLMCGLKEEDFGDSFNPAKFNAYFGLNMSGCQLLKTFPRICVVDDYEQIKPDIKVNHIQEEQITYILTENGATEIDEIDSGYVISDNGKKVIRKSDNEEFFLFKGVKKYPVVESYKDIESAPALNSFDGQGLCDPEWAKAVAVELGLCTLDEEGNIESGYLPSQFIIRAPWIKGMVATFPLREYLADNGIDTVIDVTGKERNVSEIDIFLSKSQWKTMKIYKEKCNGPIQGESVNPWDYHQKQMIDNGLQWGIVVPNKEVEDDIKTLNYQYINAMVVNDRDLDELCKPTEEYLEKMCRNEIASIVKALQKQSDSDEDEKCNADELEQTVSESEHKTLWEKVVFHNYEMLHDKHIQQMIIDEGRKKFNGAKIGKLLTPGNYQFIVSDPVAHMQWIIKNHTKGHEGQEVYGVLPAGHIFAHYWLEKSQNKDTEEIVLMRSPLIDQHEITKMKLWMKEIGYFRYLKSGIVLSIHDLATLQMQNCDFDGDRCYSTNMEVIKRSCLKNPYPLYYENQAKPVAKEINKESLIDADLKGMNSKVGKITNKAASFYAMKRLYKEDSREARFLSNAITVMGEVVGVEIDEAKTGIAPKEPYDWKMISPRYKQEDNQSEENQYKTESAYNEFEKIGWKLHNNLVPSKKAYYFRYIYPYLDRDIRILKNELNKEALYNHGKKLDVLLQEHNFSELDKLAKEVFKKQKVIKDSDKKYTSTEDEQQMISIWNTIRKYYKALPVLDTDCTMNRICHRFEEFQKNFTIKADGENLLGGFNKGSATDNVLIGKVAELLALYQQYDSLITRKNNTQKSISNSQIAKDTKNRLNMIRSHIWEQIKGLFKGASMQIVFDYMLAAAKNEKLIWEIMDEDILKVIPEKKSKDGQMFDNI